MLSHHQEARDLADQINAAHGNGRVVAHPDVIVDDKLLKLPAARQLRDIQDQFIQAAKPINCIGGSG